MRKISLFVFLVLVPLFVFSAENKMQMVSYFPVPYVAYNDVTVTQFCDVGLLNQCSMNVGPGDSTKHVYVLNVAPDTTVSGANVLNTGTVKVESGRLNLNSGVAASRIYSSRADVGLVAGVSDSNMAGEVSFSHTANVSAVPAARSVSASNATLLKSLQIYPTRLNANFPGCPEGVTWKRIALDGTGSDTVLVCGAGASLNICSASTKPTVSEACATGCGTRTRRVWCNNGTWVAEGWSACGQKPAATVPCTSASYGCGGSATRTVSCGSDGQWNTTAWNFSACFNEFGGGQSQSCSSGCGTQTSTSGCSGAIWNTSGCYSPSSPSSCSCSSVGLCGSAYPTSSCSGGSCNYSSCTSCCSGCSGSDSDYNYDYTSESRACNTCGTQSRSASRYQVRYRSCNCNSWGSWGSYGSWSSWSWGGWGSCSVSSPSNCCSGCSGSSSETQACGTCNTGKQTRTRSCNCNTWGSWGGWGSCTGATTPTCSGSSTQSCPSGYTGTQTRTCNCGTWSGWTGTCTPVAQCSNGATQGSQSCGNCNLGKQTTQKCVNGKWTSSLGTCSGAGACAPGDTKKCPAAIGGGTNTCTNSCTWGGCACADDCTCTKDAKGNNCYWGTLPGSLRRQCLGQDFQGVTRICAL